MTCDNCNEKHAAAADLDSRFDYTHGSRALAGAVLGPNLGGGFSGSFLGSGVGRVGGGITEPASHAYGADPLDYPQVRLDFHFDYSTPKRIFQRRPEGGALNRELGGLV